MNFWVIFLTGLSVGGLSCLAVQGGLLASVIAVKEEEKVEKRINTKNTIFPTMAFLLTKLIAYTILGLLLGIFGKAIGITPTAQIIMQFTAGLYMIFVGLNLLNVHPIFRYAVIQPPKFLARKVWSESKRKDLFAPAFLGAMTIFIPCGTTLAMEALAISSANAIIGAAIMFVFVLGTMPLFFGIGWVTSVFGENFKGKFLKVAAVAVLYLGLASINGALTAGGSPVTFKTIVGDVSVAVRGSSVTQNDDINITQNVQIIITSNGYSPNYIKVRKGSPVAIKLTTKNAYSCASAFRIPSLGISRNLQPNETQTITFIPTEIGKISFTCSMGMYTGVIDVI